MRRTPTHREAGGGVAMREGGRWPSRPDCAPSGGSGGIAASDRIPAGSVDAGAGEFGGGIRPKTLGGGRRSAVELLVEMRSDHTVPIARGAARFSPTGIHPACRRRCSTGEARGGMRDRFLIVSAAEGSRVEQKRG